MAFIRRVAAFLLAITCVAAAAEPAMAQRNCREVGSYKKPVIAPGVIEIAAANGPFRFRIAYHGEKCRSGFGYLTLGLADETGKKMLVTPRWSGIVPFDATTALVENVPSANGPARLVYPLGGADPTDFLKLRSRDGPPPSDLEPLGAAQAGLATPLGVKLPVAGGGHREFRNAWIELYRNRIFVHVTAEDGTPLSQMWSVDGEPLTPVIGRIEWRDGKLFTRILPLDHPDYVGQHLFLPMDNDGRQLPIPDGSIGLLSIDDWYGTSDWGVQKKTARWGAVFAKEDGLQFAFTSPDFRSVSGPSYHGVREGAACEGHICSRYLLKQAVHWHFVDHRFQPVTFPTYGVRGGFTDPDAAIRYFLERAALPYEQLVRERNDALIAGVRAGNQHPCGANARLDAFPPDVLEIYFRTCSSSPAEWAKYGGKVAADALEAARNRSSAEEARRIEYERQQREAITRDNYDPWKAGMQAAQAALNSSHNSFLSQQQDTYRRNLDAYNSGAQSWCCGTTPRN